MKKNINPLQTLLKHVEPTKMLWEKFHEKTKNKQLKKAAEMKGPIPESWVQICFKTYPRFRSLPLSINPIDPRIWKLFHERRSTRTYSSKKTADIPSLSTLLYTAVGIVHKTSNIDDSRRTYPSGGARYPLEFYIAVFGVQGLEQGLYHYNVLDNTFEVLAAGDYMKWFEDTVMGSDAAFQHVQFAIIITAAMNRTLEKYGDRGYKLALLEAGHAAQNICLLAGEYGLGVCPLMGFDNNEMDRFLDIERSRECSLYVIVGGKTA